MQSKEMIRNYQLLELDRNAPLEDVELSYRRLLRRYEPGGLASYGLLRVADRGRLLSAIRDAYQQIMRQSSTPPQRPDSSQPRVPSGDGHLASLHAYLQSKPELRSDVLHAMAIANEHQRVAQMQCESDDQIPIG